jgi:hypothetical protein
VQHFGDTYVKNVASPATAAKLEAATRIKHTVRNELRLKWGKFSDQNLSAFTDNNDLVTQLAGKYGLEKAHAQRDVDDLMKGRQIDGNSPFWRT